MNTFQTPPTLGIERFPNLHQGTYVEKRPSQTLRPFILERHSRNLSSLSQEGALQRAFPIAPNNLKRSLFLPEFLLKFRHKLWLQRLPTLHLRHLRDDHEDEAPVTPLYHLLPKRDQSARDPVPCLPRLPGKGPFNSSTPEG